MAQQVKGETVEYGAGAGRSGRRHYSGQPHALPEPAARPLLTRRRWEDERCPMRPREQLLPEQTSLDARQVDNVIAPVLCERRGHRHRRRVGVHEIVSELEPHALARSHHAGKQYQPLRVFREPRSELLQLGDGQRPALRTVPDRRNVQHTRCFGSHLRRDF